MDVETENAPDYRFVIYSPGLFFLLVCFQIERAATEYFHKMKKNVDKACSAIYNAINSY